MAISDYGKKLADFLKGIYYYFEDRWYAVLDKIDPKIPVYKVIDPIDRVIPSFVLFLLLLLFIIIFLLYFIKFTSPYDVTFVVSDAQSKSPLSGVVLAGTINDEVFNEKTDSSGKAFVKTSSIRKNFFDIVAAIFFGDNPLFFGIITAKKDGYVSLEKKELELSDKENKLFLEKMPEPQKYPNPYKINLVDTETNNLIVDDLGRAYVKFRCDNKTISGQPRKVTDMTDSSTDGVFTLTEENCAFVVTEAYAFGYEPEGSPVTPPYNKDEYDIKLRKIPDPNDGIAKVGVYSTETDGNHFVPRIRIDFYKGATSSYAVTDNGGWAEKTLETGRYNITISDANYYSIRADSNIFIDVVKGQTTLLYVKLVKINPSDKRMVFFKVVDSVDNNALPNVSVELLDLVIDRNGNYSGVNSNDSTSYYSGPPNITDGNGLYKRIGLSVLNKNVLGVLKKDGYIYKFFKPALLNLTDSYETVTLEKATASNSGKATVTVKSTTGKLLPRANTFLYFTGTIAGINVKNLKINGNGVLTNSSGVATHTELPIGTYSASAYFDGAFSGITATKDLDANQLINFDVNINLSVAYLKLELIDAENLSRITSADVNISFVENNGLVFNEKPSYSNGFFVSKPYPRGSKLAISIKSGNYVARTVNIDPLTLGENFYTIKLYSLNMPDCPTTDPDCNKTIRDFNVSVFFDDIYAQNDNYNQGRSTALAIDVNGTYKVKFDVVIASPINYEQLLGMVRANGPIEFTNPLPDPTSEYRKEQGLFDCNNASTDNSAGIRPDSYYLPTDCHNTNDKKVQAGYRWGDANIPVGVYSFVASFAVGPEARNDDRVMFQYRAKEKNSTNSQGASETYLKFVDFYIGQPLRSGFFFKVKTKTQTLTINPKNMVNYPRLNIYPNEENVVSIQMQNNSNSYLNNGSLKIYSARGPNISSVYGPGLGHIFFDSGLALTEKTMISGLNIAALGRSGFIDTNVFAKKFNSTNWIIIVAQFDSNTYVGFIEAKSAGKSLLLSAEFLAGVQDQIFDGEVRDKYGSGKPVISEVEIEVDKNCSGTMTLIPPVYKLTTPSNNIDVNYFTQKILGIYEYMKDCVFVSVRASGPENEYDPIVRQRIFAGSGSSMDPSLACVDITLTNGTQNVYLEEDLLMNWNTRESFRIKNNCPKSVTISVDIGLVCSDSQGNACSSETVLGVGETKFFTMTGKNIDYVDNSPKPNFTDVLGYYPVIVKGKFTNESIKKFSIIARAHVHLKNPNQCFAISQDYFDFTEGDQRKKDLILKNDCQYSLIGNYYIPKAVLNAFGYDLNNNLPKYSAELFTPKATIRGNVYATRTITENITTWGTVYPGNPSHARSTSIPGENQKHYYNVQFDLSETNVVVDKLQFRFIDLDNIHTVDVNDLNNPSPDLNVFGARIEGDVVITYKDGTVVRKSPAHNFDINDFPACIRQGTPLAGERCEVDREDNYFVFGLFYMNIAPKAGIQRIDINVAANPDLTHLELSMRPHLNIVKQTQITELTGTTQTITTNLTANPVSIPAFEGIIYTVKDISDMNELSQTAYTTINNPVIFVSSDNPRILTWIEGESLKATFIGDDYAPFNDTTIEGLLVKTFGQSITYGSVNVTDYVSSETAGGRTISGVQ